MLHAKPLFNGFFQELILSHCHTDRITNKFHNRKLKIVSVGRASPRAESLVGTARRAVRLGDVTLVGRLGEATLPCKNGANFRPRRSPDSPGYLHIIIHEEFVRMRTQADGVRRKGGKYPGYSLRLVHPPLRWIPNGMIHSKQP